MFLVCIGFEFIFVGVVDSKCSLLNYDGLDVSWVLVFFNDEVVEQDEELLFLWMCVYLYDDLVVLDVIVSEQLVDQYFDFVSYGFYVISVNKLVGVSSSDKYCQIYDVFEKMGCYWLYNVIVGVGLLVNYMVCDLIDSGDIIFGLSGIFLGMFFWLFLQFDGIVLFIDLVDQVWQQGLIELDLCVDLFGKDVMCKLVIFVWEVGYDIELDQVCVELLVLVYCEEGLVDYFFENGEELNEQMLQCLEVVCEMGLVFCYVVCFDVNGKVCVGVEVVCEEYLLVVLLLCDNVFVIESCWYCDNLLVICGSGVGCDVIVGVIQLDINCLVQLL